MDYLNPEQQPGGNEGAIQTLINRKVDVIVAVYGSTVKAARAMTDTVPIVMVAVDYDPLLLGYVKERRGRAGILPASTCSRSILPRNALSF